jgi:hypothetical protein
MSSIWSGRSSGPDAEEAAEIEKISRERGLINQGDDGISEAPPGHGVIARLRNLLHPDSGAADPAAPEASEDAVWERERERRHEQDQGTDAS